MRIKFDSLIGKPITDIGHAADICWIIIGDDSISINCSSDVSISLDGVEIVNSDDMIEINESRQTPFRIKMARLFSTLGTVIIEDIFCDESNQLFINCSKNLSIHTITTPCDGEEDELWRIFKRHSSLPHIIATGGGIEI